MFCAVCRCCRWQAYIEQKLNPTLLKALTALASEKPTSQPAEAVVFLANRLLEHNPNKPRVAVPQELLLQQQRQLQQAQLAAAAADAAAAAASKQRVAAQKSVSRGKVAQEAGVQQSAGGLVVGEEDLQQAAATKVQSAFRGHQARKQVAGMRQSQAEAAEAAEAEAPTAEEPYVFVDAAVEPAAVVEPAA